MNRIPRAACLGILIAIPQFAAAADELAARQAAAKAATQQLVQQLGEKLKQEIATGGAPAAIAVCRDAAPQIAGELSRSNGWRITRVSTRVRNPMLGMPDAWEQQVLADFETRVAQGENPADLARAEVVEEPSGRYFRFMKAIPVQAVCLNCHGAADKIAEPVQAKLKALYPMDRATGYSEGELRGAVSIKQPLDIPLVAAQP